MSGNVLFAIFLLPVFAMTFIGLVLRPFFKDQPKLSGYTLIACLTAALGLSIWVLASHDFAAGPLVGNVEWAIIGDFVINLGFHCDELTAMMLIVVTGVSLMVQIYSQGYMAGDTGYIRYFCFMALFTSSMLGLVLASSILLVYVFWEGVGLGSYLLIGFWFHKPSAAAAAKKAFVVTRFGDFGFLVGILILYFNTGTFEIHGASGINELALAGAIGFPAVTLGALGVFSGAVGKSAQFPLHTWLPDAMEGPTPVSSLIHAATMVAAGVYLVARMLPLFVVSEPAIITVAVVGGFTAIFAATMGLVMNDIKRVLAYSTISQLGYMMLGLGAVGIAANGVWQGGGFEYHGQHVGMDAIEVVIWLGVAVGIFHLFTHAFFKCLLFLGAGSVSHATGTFDMRLMGGLRRYQPWTFLLFLIGSLALAGIWPLAGFWSKDMIVLSSWDHAPAVLFWFAMITVFLTAFYMFRAIFMTFFGEYRGGEPDHGHGDSHGHGEPHESPKVMLLPMTALAVMAVGAGWSFWGGGVDRFLAAVNRVWEHHHVHWHGHGFFDLFTKVGEEPMPLIALVVALAGVGSAWAIYKAGWISAESIGRVFAPLHALLSRKYYMDELYEQLFVIRALQNGFNYFIELFDTYIVDGTVNGVASLTMGIGGRLRRVETGQLQAYGLAIAIGILIIMVVYFAVGS